MNRFLLVLTLSASLSTTGCALWRKASDAISSRDATPEQTTPNEFRSPANVNELDAISENLGAFFFDGNAFAGDISGLSRDGCAIAAEKRFDAEGKETLTFEVSGKTFIETFTKEYPRSIVLSESGKALIFVGKGESLMEHPGRQHVFSLHNEKANEGDFMIKLVMKFERIARGGYRFREFYVSAGRTTRVVTCNDLAVVR